MKTLNVRLIGAALLIVWALLPLLPIPEYWVTLLNYTALYAIPVVGLVLLTGFARMTSFGQAALVGLGAYATAYLSYAWHLSPWIGLVVGVALAVAVAGLIGLVTLRLSGHFLSLATLAWGLALFFFFGTVEALGKYDGLSGLPAIGFFGWHLVTPRQMYYPIWVALLLAIFAVSNLLDSRFGRSVRALKGGKVLSEAMGVDTAHTRLVVFMLAAAFAGVAGFLYAGLQRAVNPTPFGVGYGIEYLFMAVVGGLGYVWGALVGSAVITLLKDGLSVFLPSLLGTSGNYEVVALGVLMILLLQRAPEGVCGFIARHCPVRPTARAPHADSVPALPRRPRPVAVGALLQVKAARKEFGGLVAVNDVSFDVDAGQIVGLIGPNGAGKSTTFNLVTGVLPLTSGEIRFAGERIDGLGSRRIVARGIGRTFQHVKLLPDMTVLENVALGAHLRGSAGLLRAVLRLERPEEKRLLAEAARQIERVGLADHMYTLAGSLALGQQRIVEIARALAGDPTLLLLDEPAAGLRYQEKQALAALLRRLKAEGMSVLLVEHDMDFVMNLTDRLVVMEFGTRIAEGVPAEVQRNPAVLAAYLGGVQ